jgi:alkyl hydroperoxide reductase subunit AhpC
MALQLGEIAPDFTADSTLGRLNFHEWLNGSWALLLSHPRDFTPVCTTELGALARLKPQFQRRGVKVLGLSLDTVQSHEQWSQDIRETQGTAINFPIISDLDRQVAHAYGMLHPQHDPYHTVRTVFIIDPRQRIRLTMTYPQSCGRNFDELLRVIDSLQLTDGYSVSTPANWHAGDDVIILPSMTDEDARLRFPQGWQSPRPYLRITPDPRN